MNHFIFESTAKQKGTLLSFKELKKGNFIEASKSEKNNLMTTMLTDIPEKLWDFCNKLSPNVQRKVIKPNGFTSGTFIFEYISNNFKIKITRKLISWQKWLLSTFYNALKGNVNLQDNYAELPTNYKIIIDVKTKSDEISNKIKNFLKDRSKDRKSIIK